MKLNFSFFAPTLILHMMTGQHLCFLTDDIQIPINPYGWQCSFFSRSPVTTPKKMPEIAFCPTIPKEKFALVGAAVALCVGDSVPACRWARSATSSVTRQQEPHPIPISD